MIIWSTTYPRKNSFHYYNGSNFKYKLFFRFFTLYPGDVILTGTPGGVGMYKNPPQYLKPGDVIESEIEAIGKIINKVV